MEPIQDPLRDPMHHGWLFEVFEYLRELAAEWAIEALLYV